MKQNYSIINEYGRAIEQYKNLLAIFNEFNDAEDQKFEKVWNLHLDELGELTKQVIDMDRMICHRLLQWNWKGPPNIRDVKQLMVVKQKELIGPKITPTTKHMKQKKRIQVKEDEGQQQLKSEDSICSNSSHEGQEVFPSLCGRGEGAQSAVNSNGVKKDVNNPQAAAYSCGSITNDDSFMGNAHRSAMISLLSREASFLSSNFSLGGRGGGGREADDSNTFDHSIENHLPEISPNVQNILLALGVLTDNDLKVCNLRNYSNVGGGGLIARRK